MHGEVYLDESGTHEGSSCVAMAGYVSSPERWHHFSMEWADASAGWDLKAFHMKEYARRRPPYDKWNRSQYEARFARLMSIVNRNAMGVVACAVKRSGAELFSEAVLGLCGTAYGHVATGCMVNAMMMAHHLGFTSLHYTFGDVPAGVGKADVDAAYERLRKRRVDREIYRIAGIRRGGTLTYPPLQAADIAAYEHYRRGVVQFGGQGERRRYSMRRIMELPRIATAMDEDGVREFNQIVESGASFSDEQLRSGDVPLSRPSRALPKAP